jgi:prophage regulatory protein
MVMLRMPQVVAITGLSRMTIYRLEKRRQFPSRVQLSPNSVGWRKEDVDHWVESRPKVVAPGDPLSTLSVAESRSVLLTRS